MIQQIICKKYSFHMKPGLETATDQTVRHPDVQVDGASQDGQESPASLSTTYPLSDFMPLHCLTCGGNW